MSIYERVEEVRKKEKYRKRTKIQCPAFLGEPVHLSTHFWTHVRLQRNERPRTEQEVLERLSSIDIMIEIIESSSYYQDYYENVIRNKKFYYWTFIAVIDAVRYGVIIRRKGKTGNRHFYSIIPNYEGYIPREKRLKVIG